jgi:site-specific DNA recombinase
LPCQQPGTGENTHALEQQIARIKEAGAEEILVDVESGRSNREDDRTEFKKLIRLVEQQQVDKVIVTRFDRLCRSLPTLRKVLDAFQVSEVALVALTGPLRKGTQTRILALDIKNCPECCRRVVSTNALKSTAHSGANSVQTA